MADLCDYTYAELAQGRSRAQLAELDATLAPPDERETHRERMNQESMKQLGIGMVAPPKKAARG